VDNSATTPVGASQVYFSVLGNESCGRNVTATDTNASKVFTLSAPGVFTAGDIGATVTGPGMTANTTIASITDPTDALLNKNANSGNTGTFTITATGGCSTQAAQSNLN
jgi:hypothetical protein